MDNVLLASGLYTKTDNSKMAYAFIYDYMSCLTSPVYEFTGMNQGIHTTDSVGVNIFLYGTNLNQGNITSEQIVQLERNPGKKLKLKLIKSFGLPEISEKAIPDGLLFDGNYYDGTIIVVT